MKDLAAGTTGFRGKDGEALTGDSKDT